jgi:TPR repeat protein
MTHPEIAALQRSAESSNPEAQLEFGMACQTRHDLLGLSFAEGHMQAVGWFEKAAKQGNALAQRMFAASMVGHPAEMMQWYERAAEQGDIGSAYSLGQMYLDGNLSGKPEPAQAAHWFLVAAKGGDIEAAFKVGSFYECGSGVSHDDVEAAKWYHVAAEQGWKPAQLQLGRLYANGRGVPQDALEAARWYSKAADRYADAAYEYASLIVGHHVPGKSKEDARQLYRQAATLYRKDAIVGNAAAPQKLGHMYESATGVDQSFAEAYFWYSIAEQEGSPASGDVERVRVRLTAKQANDVQKRVAKWLNDF